MFFFCQAAFAQTVFLDAISEKDLEAGIKLYNLKYLTTEGSISATALKIDLSSAEVRPALAKRRVPNFLESVVSFFTPWAKNNGYSEHFSLEKVSILAQEHNALAGINGTYFSSSGKPLGALMINQELISAPINGRTALLIDAENRVMIDKVLVLSYFVLADGISHRLTGINQPRGENDAILYAPIWGERTGTNDQGIELVVKQNRIEEINISNSKIPSDGFVVSLSGPAVEFMAEKFKVKDPIQTYIKVIPYSASPAKIIHLISGGPRLLKQGKSYVSKHEEKFKPDIAEGRAPRSAVGITPQNELLLVAVAGATLEELAGILKSLGATEAMNLDGGSSSTLVVKGKAINNPAGGAQRRVSNAILIRPK